MGIGVIVSPNHLIMVREKALEKWLWPEGKSAKGGVIKFGIW
jgi:hypothetical protein